MASNPWPEAEVRVLQDLHAKGLTAREICHVLPKTISAVNSKRNRIGLFTYPFRTPLSISAVQEGVCEAFGLSLDDMLGKRRLRSVARPRQIAMYLSRRLTCASYTIIAKVFRRDHTTILHGVRTIESLIEADATLRATVEALEISIEAEPIHSSIQAGTCVPPIAECPMEQSKIDWRARQREERRSKSSIMRMGIKSPKVCDEDRVHRDPCVKCGIRADIGCVHTRVAA